MPVSDVSTLCADWPSEPPRDIARNRLVLEIPQISHKSTA